MTKQQKQAIGEPCIDQTDDETNFLDYWEVIWKRRKMIGGIVIVAVFATVIISLFMKNIYQAKAVIMPVTARDTGGSGAGLTALAQQFGGLPGISIPGPTSASEIVSLLKSNILRERIIQRYNLLPVLFYKRWDTQQRSWKKGGDNLDPDYYLAQLSRAVIPMLSNSIEKKTPIFPIPGTHCVYSTKSSRSTKMSSRIPSPFPSIFTIQRWQPGSSNIFS